MHAKPRTLLAALSLVLGVANIACGGPVPPVCSACQYGNASYVVDAQLLQGGTIVSATMHTEVDHTVCPYGTDTSPCTATLDMNVLCKTPGAGGPYVIERRPNGLKHGSTNQPSNVNLVVNVPRVGHITVPVPVTFTSGSATSAISPCGGSTTPTVTH